MENNLTVIIKRFFNLRSHPSRFIPALCRLVSAKFDPYIQTGMVIFEGLQYFQIFKNTLAVL
jgi:hypothetical protein